MAETTALVAKEQINPVALFNENGLDPILEGIRQKAMSFEPDLSSDKGRKEIKSMANKVARSKTLLDDMGKELVSDWKEKAKRVDAERKRMRDYLDSLKKEVRLPLTEWEDREKARVAEIKSNIEWFRETATKEDEEGRPLSADEIRSNLESVKSVSIGDNFDEFANDAAQAKDAAVTFLEKALEQRIAHEKEQAELERLRREAEERERKEREEKIAREAAEKAKREAEEAAERKAREVRERAERERLAELNRIREEQDARDRAEREKREKAEAEERMQNEAVRILMLKKEREAQAEIDRLRREAEEKARIEKEKAAEEARLRADEEHTRKVCRSVFDGMVDLGCPKSVANEILQAIKRGDIPHLSINY